MDEKDSTPEGTQFAPITRDADETHTSHSNSTSSSRTRTHTHTHTHAQRPSTRDSSHKERFDPELDIDLPYRTLTSDARLDEYKREVPGGEIPTLAPPSRATTRNSISRHHANNSNNNNNVAGANNNTGGEGAQPERLQEYRLVAFEPNDPENPKNWSKAFKWYITMVVAATCFVVALASSVVTADIPGVSREFGVSEEVSLLSISLFVVGFGVGPMAFAPLSEILGRRII